MSLRRRLGRGLITVLIGVFVIHWVAADWAIRFVAEKQMANRLFDDVYSLMETLEGGDDDTVRFDSYHISSVYRLPESGHYYTVRVDTRVYSSPSLIGRALDALPLGPDQTRLYHVSDANRRSLLVAGLGIVKFGHRINISVAEDLSAVDHDITAIRVAYLGLTLLILVCAIALQRWDVDRAFRPLVNVGDELEQVAKGQREQLELDVPAEVQPLVKEVNRLLQLVERRLQQSRTAMGNLAHALKSPVTMLFRTAEHAVFELEPVLKQQLQEQTDAIHRCIERELKRARIAGSCQSGASFNPKSEIFDLTRLLDVIHADKHLQINVSAPDLILHFDREDMLEMLGNLLDNACKWAHRRIDVDISCSEEVLIDVRDDGPGCSENQYAVLTRRGVRLDESVSGHGLGLAIVSDIVSVYRGSLRVGRSSDLGGFQAKITLPLSSFS